MLCNAPYCCRPAAYRLVFTKQDEQSPRTFMCYACKSHRDYVTRVWTEDAADYVACTSLQAQRGLPAERTARAETGAEEHEEADLIVA